MLEPEPDKVKFGGLVPSWHHVDCFLENLNSLDASGVAPEELSGFVKLTKEEKDELKQKFIAKVGQVKKGWVIVEVRLSLAVQDFVTTTESA